MKTPIEDKLCDDVNKAAQAAYDNGMPLLEIGMTLFGAGTALLYQDGKSLTEILYFFKGGMEALVEDLAKEMGIDWPPKTD